MNEFNRNCRKGIFFKQYQTTILCLTSNFVYLLHPEEILRVGILDQFTERMQIEPQKLEITVLTADLFEYMSTQRSSLELTWYFTTIHTFMNIN